MHAKLDQGALYGVPLRSGTNRRVYKLVDYNEKVVKCCLYVEKI